MAEEAHLHHFFVSCVHSAAFRRLNRPPSPFVHVVARLPPASLARLRAVLTANDELVEVVSWHELSSVLRSQPIDLIVLDPRARGDEPGTQDRDEPSVLLTLLTEFRSVPAILYSTHTREGLRAVLPLIRSGAHQVIFRGFDDTHERLRALLDQLAASALGERLLAVIIPKLEQADAPLEVIEAIARLYRAPTAFRTVEQLAAVSGRSRGQLDRYMHKAGLASAKVLMLAARVAWTFHYVRAPVNSLKAVALRLGYADTVKLSRHVHWMTEMTLSQLRRNATADQVLDLLRVRVLRAEEPSSAL